MMCRQFGNVEGPDNTHSSVEVFGDCKAIALLIVVAARRYDNQKNRYKRKFYVCHL
jgi:hypothetical protein